MDQSHYKDITVSRGLNYHYYIVPSTASKPYLLFVHGFPSTSWDWHNQVKFFKNEGYGLIVPDLLGYGGTSKPLDATAYKASLITKDLIDILDAEKVGKAIAIGHDWGSAVVSRLANYHPDRFIAFAFAAVGYMPPTPGATIDQVLAGAKQALGGDWSGYWTFFSSPEAKDIISAHWDSFFSLVFPADPNLWTSALNPVGATKEYLLKDHKAPLPSYLTEEDKKIISQHFDHGKAIQSPLLWYNTLTENIEYEDAKSIPLENHDIKQPVFFAAALKDTVCLPDLYKAFTSKHCSNLTIKDFDVDHWVPFSAADELNKELEAWIDGIDSSV